MIGRRVATAILQPSSIAAAEDQLVQIASLCRANTDSVQRLDASLVDDLNWNLGVHGAIAELTAPKWFASGGGRFGWREDMRRRRQAGCHRAS